jgi:hypothetical protein
MGGVHVGGSVAEIKILLPLFFLQYILTSSIQIIMIHSMGVLNLSYIAMLYIFLQYIQS